MLVDEVLGRAKAEEDGQEQQNGAVATKRAGLKENNLKLPEEAVKAGTAIVRKGIEQTVDVKTEQVEDKEWRDWR